MVMILCACVGCATVRQNVYRTVHEEPAQFSWRRDRSESRALYESWAADAWSAQRANRAPCDSADFAVGFQTGFVEYCYAGGSGEPPPVPPRPYWNALNRVAPLREGAAEWFDGYRLGASVAREGGYRDQAVLPASASLCSRDDHACAGGDCQAPSVVDEYEILEQLPPSAPLLDGPMPPTGVEQPLLYEPASGVSKPGLERTAHVAPVPTPLSPDEPPATAQRFIGNQFLR